MKLEVGNWILKEGVMVGHLNRPVKVSKIAGSRVYYERVHLNRAGEVDEVENRHCQMKSVKYIVPSEEKGNEIWEELYALREMEREEERKVQTKYGDLARKLLETRGAVKVG